MSQNNIVVQSFLNESKFSAFQWMIFSLCFCVVLLDGFDTAAIGYIAPSLLKEWGIAKPDLAPVLSAALYGLAGGALVAGPLSDIFGRRLMLIASVFLFGICSFASASSGSLQTLTVLRFVTGVGLGAAMPNALTLISEYCPDKQRSMLTNAMFCAFPLGASLGGFLSAQLIPAWGWRGILQIGGIAPILLALILVAFLPESIRFLVGKKRPISAIRALLIKISPKAENADFASVPEPAAKLKGPAVVLSTNMIAGTLMLWTTYFMGLVIFYALINWMPTLLVSAGFESKQASLISALFPLGGIGAIASGWLMDRYNANWVVCSCYALTAFFIYSIGQSVGSTLVLMSVIFVAGILMNTAQCSLPSLAAAFYPTDGRATGIAWMLGIGRFGAIASTYLIAELVRNNLNFSEIFSIVALPAVLASLAILIKQTVNPSPAL